MQIEHDSAWNLISRYDSPETPFFVDPPYVASTPTVNKGYRHGFVDADHRRLQELLDSPQGMVILSGFHWDLHRELFGHWDRHGKETLMIGRSGDGPTYRTEVVWLNDRLRSRRPHN